MFFYHPLHFLQSYCSQVSNFPSALNSAMLLSFVFFFSFSFSGFTGASYFIRLRVSLFNPRKKRGFFFFSFFFFYSMDGFDPSPFRSLRIIVPRISPRSLFPFQPFRFYVFVFSPLSLRVYFVYLFFFPSLFLSSIFGPGYFYLIVERVRR